MKSSLKLSEILLKIVWNSWKLCEIFSKIYRKSNFSQQLREILLKSKWNPTNNYGDILKGLGGLDLIIHTYGLVMLGRLYTYRKIRENDR